jgi:hypothetical protein
MTLRASVEPLSGNRDPRGVVIEPLGPRELPIQRNIHLVLTGPGQVRGNHLHRLETEIVTVLGPAPSPWCSSRSTARPTIPQARTCRGTC